MGNNEVGNRGLVSLLLLYCQVHGRCSWGPGFWVSSWLEGQGHRSCGCYSVSVGRDTTEAGRLVLCGLPPLKLLEFLGLWVHLPQLKVWDGRRFFLCPLTCLLCVAQSTHLQVYRLVEFSSILVCWAESPLLSCGYFTGCRWKARDKGSNSCHHYADSSLQFSSLLSRGCQWEQGLI